MYIDDIDLVRKVNGTYAFRLLINGEWIEKPTTFEQPPLNDGDQDPFANRPDVD